MANPQAENGHVDIANEIVDRLCSYRIPGEEWLVLWVILRKTYGWHKKEDEISVTQFEKITKMKRSNVYRAIKSLLSKKIIAIIKSDNSNINLYRFNKDFDQWGGIIKSDTPIIKSDNKSIIKSDTHKRKERKKTLRVAQSPDVKVFITWWIQSFKSKFGSPYVVSWGKESSLVKSLLVSFPINALQDLASKFLNSSDEFIKKAGYSIPLFYNQINKLNSQKQVESNRWK